MAFSRSQAPAAPTPVRRRPAAGAAAATAGAVVVAVLAAWLRVRQLGDVTGLLAVGRIGQPFPYVNRVIPGVYAYPNYGHDGQHFFVIANWGWNVHAASRWLDLPAFRYRRITYPLLARALVPGGGRSLVFGFVAVSLIGVALGAWSLSRMRGCPPWLPLVFALNPGVLASLWFSLSDALGAGLVVAAFAASQKRRHSWALVLVILAALTKEANVLAAFALAFSPGMSRPRRAVMAVVPAAIEGVWSLAVLAVTHGSRVDLTGEAFGLPLRGLLLSQEPASGRTVTWLIIATLAVGLVRALDRSHSVAVLLALTLVTIAFSSDIVASSWLNVSRVVTGALPLALWAVFAEEPAPVNRPRAAPVAAP